MLNSDVLKEKIAEAQLVLVGIGEEFNCKEVLMGNERYLQIEAELKENDKYIWILPYVQHVFLKKYDPLVKSIEKLSELLKDKNYFIVTTCMHGIIENAGFKENRVVSPCGNFRKLQCTSTECNRFETASEELYMVIEEYCVGTKTLEDIKPFLCPECNSTMEFNSLYTESYKEAGYAEMWGLYTKWLQGTLNKKLCVLELGVSLDYPSVIRFPFEKIAFFNQKAVFIRVHERLYQLSDEIGEKGISHKENAISFLNSI